MGRSVWVVTGARSAGAGAAWTRLARSVATTGCGLGRGPICALATGGLWRTFGFLTTRLGRRLAPACAGLGGAGLGHVSLGGVSLGGSHGRGLFSWRFGGGGLLRHRLSRARLGGGFIVRLLVCLGCRRELLAHLPHDGRLERGRGRLDEFTCFLQVTHQFFAGDSELFGELVDTQLCHISPFRKRLRCGDALLILLAAHRWVLIGCPSASNPLPLSRRRWRMAIPGR